MDKEYLDNFERRVLDELLRLCTSYHLLDGTLLASDDIDGKWREMAPEYMADAVEQTWTDASSQIKTVVNNVVFPVVDMVLAILFFVKVGTAYFDYRKHGQFEFAAPCILFACLIFTLTAPLYIWTIL